MKKHDIVLFHGLNNNQDCFLEMRSALESEGFTVHIFSLLGYDQLCSDLSLNKCIKHIAKQFKKLPKSKKFYCIGFSQGGLILQLLPEEIKRRIVKQVLLAPALVVKHGEVLEKIVNLLPESLPIISLAPKLLSQFSWLSNGYFKSLFAQVNKFESLDLSKNKLPTLIIADIDDELVDVGRISQIIKTIPEWEIITLKRSDMKFMHLSQHHVVFHPNYFSKKEWKILIKKISKFLTP